MMTDRASASARYPLRAVIRRTGLSADVLRAWERRYGAVHPERSAGGQRLYSDDDVARLTLLRRATTSGHSIGEIARLDRAALEALLGESTSRALTRSRSNVDVVVEESIAAAERLDAPTLEGVLKRGALAIGTESFVDDALPRFLHAVGDRWHRGELTPAHEHLASATVRRVLAWVVAAYGAPADAPTLVAATPSREQHEFGAMLVSAAAAGEGWRVVYLGASLPAADIVAAATQVHARAVALSVVYLEDGDVTLSELRHVARSLPAGTRVFVGGAAADRAGYANDLAGVSLVHDLATFRLALRAEASTSRSARPGGG